MRALVLAVAHGIPQAFGHKPDKKYMHEIRPSASERSDGRSWLTPAPVSHTRVLAQAGRLTGTVWTAAALVIGILLATALSRSAWAALPIAALLVAMPLGPLAIRHVNPEHGELAVSLFVTIAMAIAAGMSGGTSSPLVFLLPIGVVLNAVRAGPASVVICSLVTAVLFVVASLVADAKAVLSEPLPMVAVLVMQAGVTLGSVVLVREEIGHRRASIVDPLTGLLNRHGLADRFEELRQQALLTAAPITLVLFDLDRFKHVNDSHGHDVGDRLLREVAEEVRRSLRKFELLYRVGGEEFLILLPGMAQREGVGVAEELRVGIERVGLRAEVGLTASFGVSCASGEGIVFEQLYRQADQAMYQAKRGGRDRVSASAIAPVGLANAA